MIKPRILLCIALLSAATSVAQGLPGIGVPYGRRKPKNKPSAVEFFTGQKAVPEKPVAAERVIERHHTNTVVQVRPVTNVVEREVIVERPVTNTVVQVRPVTNVVEREVIVERPVTNTVVQVRPVTNVVEKLIVDRAAEEELKAQNRELAERLAASEDRAKRLERVAPREALKYTGRPARITATDTFYDNRQGIAIFAGNVWVDDERYQMHADKAYVLKSATNDLRRIVALGHVALTNETKRAYGTKASYFKDNGMVVLYGDPTRPAEVRDESKVEDQVVYGEKIRFWINKQQVEVIKSVIVAPVQGGSAGVRNLLGR